MNDLITAIILGIVEGVTEFLPVSSTGHLILATRFLGYVQAHWALFNIVIQLGSILAIVVLYWRTLWAVLMGLIRWDPVSVRFTRNVLIGFLPAAVVGAALHHSIEDILASDKAPLIVGITLLVGGIAIIGIERFVKEGDIRGVADIPLPKVIAIGVIQCLSMIPGVSRSGATILGGLSLGVERRTAAEFSFFLAIPTMLGATVFELVSKHRELMNGNSVGISVIAVGFVVSFIVALVVVKGFVTLIGRTGFTPFGFYRIAIGALAIILLTR